MHLGSRGWQGEASGWWFDHMLFAPHIAVGSTPSGEKIQGLVMVNDVCTNENNPNAAETNCLTFAPDVVYGPGYGRNPIEGDWTLDTDPPGGTVDASVQSAMPTSWSSAYYRLRFEVRPQPRPAPCSLADSY